MNNETEAKTNAERWQEISSKEAAKEREYPQKWLMLAREAFVLIRCLSGKRSLIHHRMLPTKEERLILIGELSDALENLPITPDKTFQAELVEEYFGKFIQEHPEFKKYFSTSCCSSIFL